MIRRLAEQGGSLTSAIAAFGSRERDDAPRCARFAAIASSKSYLTTALGYPWDRVHDEAERLEHAASDELIDRMAAAIGDPLTDPHGAPIPTRDGTLSKSR